MLNKKFSLFGVAALLLIALLSAVFITSGQTSRAAPLSQSAPAEIQQWDSAISFGIGLPVQLVDPTGRGTVQYTASTAPLTATFDLYALSAPQFISMYNSLPEYFWGDEAHLDPIGLPLVATWQEVVTDTSALFATRLPETASGFYLLTASDAETVQDEILVIISRDVLLLKASTIGDVTQVVAWANRLSTGAPLPDTTVAIYDRAGNLLASGVTDANGVYTTELTGAESYALIAVGEKDGELTACGTRYEWNSRDWWGYWWWDWEYYYSTLSNTPYKVYLYTDRPIYRPGHTVHYKGILRHDADGDYTPIETTRPITVTVRDARRNELAAATLFPSAFGTISGTFTLADEVGLGDYNLEVVLDGYTYRQAFKVEEYRKPEYEVAVNADANYYVVDDTINVTVAADYYFGQPVADAAVEFTLYQQDYYYGSRTLLWQTTGATDANGQWTTTIDTADYASADTTFILAATVRDASNQSVSAERRMPIHYAAYSLSVRMDKYGYEPGETVTITLHAQYHDGSPVPDAPLTITAAGYEDTLTATATTDAAGEAVVTFQAADANWYEVQAEGRDERGRAVTARTWFWIYYYDWWWGYDSDGEISVSADKDSYAVGEVAQLLIQSPVTGTALLSLERGSVHQQYPIDLPNPVTLITVPIAADYAPNIFATINIFRRGAAEGDGYYWDESATEGEMLIGSAELIVPATDRELQVELTPHELTYRPRDAAEFTVEVRDQAGNPVVAEVSLGLVDEAIYALSADLSADMHQTFYGRRGHEVYSYDSLHPTRYLYAGYPAAPTPEPDDGEEDGNYGRGEDADVRRDFPDTAYWQPGVVTDENGRAVITVALPDNLTRWRAIARAVSIDTRVGDATTHITVTQELMVRPVLPRFLVQGDLIRLRTIAHNYLAHDVDAEMRLRASGLVLLGDGCDDDDECEPPEFSLPSNGAVYRDWSAVASELGDGTVLARLTTDDDGGDAVELPLPVHPFAVPDITNRVGEVETEITETLYLSVTAIPDATSMEIRLSSSIALGLLDGLEYLIGYPYGCVEQTMGRVLPNAMVIQTFNALGLPRDRLPDDLDEIINAGLQRLYGFQHDDGSWGWWYDDDNDLYQTAYVLFGLVMTERAGYAVDESVIARGITAAQQLLAAAEDPRTRAYALYVLAVAGHGDLAAAQELLAQKDQLDYFAQAALALALFYDGDENGANELIDDLIAAAEETASTAYWRQSDEDGTYSRKAMASTTRATALVLEALTQIRPDSPLLPKAALWLMNKRTRGHWRTTQETAYAILALADYIQVSGELSPDYAYEVYLNGALLHSGAVDATNALAPIPPITVSGDALLDGDNLVRFVKRGAGRLYYALTLRALHLSDGFMAVQPAGSGLRVTRWYETLEPADAVSDSDFAVGDLIRVHLSVEAADEAWYVIIEDPIPAGCEALNERLNTNSYVGGATPPPFRWYTYGYNRKEVHDDRVTLFATRLSTGRHEYDYLMRATMPGEFSVMPTEVYLMYDPDTWARSASKRVRIGMDAVREPMRIMGDFDRNCRVTDFDLKQVAALWHTRQGETGYDAARDMDGDGDVDLVDVMWVARRGGARCALEETPSTAPELINPTARVTPANANLRAGEIFTVTVAVSDALNLDGYQFSLHFDAAMVRVGSVAVQLGYRILGPYVDNDAGEITFGAFRSATALALQGGSDEVATVSFIAAADGDAEFALTAAQATYNPQQAAGVPAVHGTGAVLLIGALAWGLARRKKR